MTEPDALGSDLIAWLGGSPEVDSTSVAGWRLDLTRSVRLRVGIRAGRLGGPYESPGLATRLGGSLDLHWSDGAITRTSLDRPALTAYADLLPSWRAAAGPEREPPIVAGPTALPAVQVYDPATAAAARDEPDRLLALACRVLAGLRAAGARRADGIVRASLGQRRVATSRGFHAAWVETTCLLELWADEYGGGAFGKRRLPTDAELAGIVSTAAACGRQLRAATPLPAGAAGVLFMPAVVEALCARYLLANLAGRAIREGRSPVSLADLDAQRSLLREDLDLTVDTTLPFELATAPCGPDGVPAGRVALIAGGRLVSPVLDSATARTFGLPPTPQARGRPAVLLRGRDESLGLGEALARLRSGVVVRDLPGLHTQSPRSWRYALTAPDAQVVHDGQPAGRCAVRLAGDFLDHLQQPTTCLVRIPEEPTPALLVLAGVRVDGA